MPAVPPDVLGPRDRGTGLGSADPIARLTRGGTAAVVATGVALVSHTAAGGAMPGLLGVLIPLLLSFSVCAVLAGVRLPWLRLSGSVAVSQLLFHTLFVLGTASGGASVPMHAHGSTVSGVLGADGHAVTHGGHDMVLAHLLAAALTVLALRHGESILGRLRATAQRFLARLLPTPLSVPRNARSTRLGIGSCHRAARILRLDLSGLSRRGPPLLTCSVPR